MEFGDLVVSFTRSGMLTLTQKEIYLALATSIWIIGEQIPPVENRRNIRPKRTAILLALDAFREAYPYIQTIGINRMEKLLSIPFFKAQHFDEISKNFQSLVFRIGEYCNEKLFRFTGNSSDIRLVLTDKT